MKITTPFSDDILITLSMVSDFDLRAQDNREIMYLKVYVALVYVFLFVRRLDDLLGLFIGRQVVKVFGLVAFFEQEIIKEKFRFPPKN